MAVLSNAVFITYTSTLLHKYQGRIRNILLPVHKMWIVVSPHGDSSKSPFFKSVIIIISSTIEVDALWVTFRVFFLEKYRLFTIFVMVDLALVKVDVCLLLLLYLHVLKTYPELRYYLWLCVSILSIVVRVTIYSEWFSLYYAKLVLIINLCSDWGLLEILIISV